MPVTICGPLKIDNVTTFALIKFGDCLTLTPKNASKSYAGSGTFNTGGAVIVNDGISSTNYIDPEVSDQTIDKNN